MSKSRRFIAGAVCPACQEVDRTVIEAVTDGDTREGNTPIVGVQRRCVACGFTEALDAEKEGITAPLPRARYDRSRETTDKVEVVRILDPAPAKKPV